MGLRHTASAGGTGSSNDIVIFYTADHDLSSIRRDEESEFLIEDNASHMEQAQLISDIASHGGVYLQNGDYFKLKHNNHSDQLSTLPNQGYQEHSQSKLTKCLQMLPQIVFFTVLLTVAALCIFDFPQVMRLFNTFIAWIKVNPYQSIGYSVLILIFSVMWTIPISYTIIMLGYTYAQVFDSKITGFLFSVPIVYVGCLSGAFLSFMTSRYLFGSFIQQQIASNAWFNKNFRLIDQIIAEEGFMTIGLMRLTFAPFGVTSYVFGVTSISIKDYMLGNMTYLFNCCSQCFIGCTLYNANSVNMSDMDRSHTNTTQKVTFIIEIVLTVVVTIVMGIVAKNILEKKLKEQETVEEDRKNRYLQSTAVE